MKKVILSSTLALLFSFGCASKKPKPKYVEEKNQAKFSRSSSLSQEPDQVLRAARVVLDKLTRESSTQASAPVKEEENTIYTGWVYSTASKDKYVQYDYNGSPRRKDLAVRRIYGFTVSPSLAGSQVALNVEEEVQHVDMKSGEAKDWKRADPEQAAFDMLLRKLKEEIRAE